jgi:hypothetical protein
MHGAAKLTGSADRKENARRLAPQGVETIAIKRWRRIEW